VPTTQLVTILRRSLSKVFEAKPAKLLLAWRRELLKATSAFSSALGSICHVVAAGTNTRARVFTWMVAISGFAAIFT
jgi:hypothetical protein